MNVKTSDGRYMEIEGKCIESLENEEVSRKCVCFTYKKYFSHKLLYLYS